MCVLERISQQQAAFPVLQPGHWSSLTPAWGLRERNSPTYLLRLEMQFKTHRQTAFPSSLQTYFKAQQRRYSRPPCQSQPLHNTWSAMVVLWAHFLFIDVATIFFSLFLSRHVSISACWWRFVLVRRSRLNRCRIRPVYTHPPWGFSFVSYILVCNDGEGELESVEGIRVSALSVDSWVWKMEQCWH